VFCIAWVVMCYEVLAMNNDWLKRLQVLIARFSHLGIDADIASLSLIDAWALYLHLSRLAES
jgi:hypothetical protein